MRELVELFVSGLDERITAIENACAADDADSLVVLAHQLKGAAGGYGFSSIGVEASAVEIAAKAYRDGNGQREALNAAVRGLAGLCRLAEAG